MSAFANSPAESQQAQPGAPPQPVAPQTPGTPSSRKWWIVLAILLVVAGAAWALRPKPAVQQAAATAAVIRTTKATSGTVRRTLRVAGSTTAKNFANIVAPMMRGPDAGRSLVLISLAKSGAYVKKGEIVAQIDAQSIKDHVDDVEAMVVQAEADIRKRQAEHAIEAESMQQSLRVYKASVDKAKLDRQASEIRTSIDQELLKLSQEEAEARYQQVLRDIETVKRRQQSEMRLLELARDKQARHRDRHKIDVVRFTITAPMGGLFVMQSIWRSGDMAQIQLGDQVAPGQPFAKIVDTSSMQLEANINQSESDVIRLGQRADVEFDAFPGLRLKGKVTAVGALAVGGWRQNYYIRNIPVRIAIEGHDNRVIPDLSASGDVVLSEREGGIVIPREAVLDGNGKPVVYVKTAGVFAPREVEVGELTNTQAAVLSGLKSGEEIAAQASAVVVNR